MDKMKVGTQPKKEEMTKSFLIVIAIVSMFSAVAFAADPASTRTLPSTIKPDVVTLGSTCCISGHYLGLKEDKLCTIGETPKKGKFTMDITQAAKCGGTYTAVVTDSDDGHVTNFSGTVTASPLRGCCTMSGNSTTGSDNIKIKGTICKKGLKWKVENGTFKTNKCSGVWSMQQS